MEFSLYVLCWYCYYYSQWIGYIFWDAYFSRALKFQGCLFFLTIPCRWDAWGAHDVMPMMHAMWCERCDANDVMWTTWCKWCTRHTQRDANDVTRMMWCQGCCVRPRHHLVHITCVPGITSCATWCPCHWHYIICVTSCTSRASHRVHRRCLASCTCGEMARRNECPRKITTPENVIYSGPEKW